MSYDPRAVNPSKVVGFLKGKSAIQVTPVYLGKRKNFTGTRNRQGNFRVGLRSEKSRYRRSLARFRDLYATDVPPRDPRTGDQSQQGLVRALCLLWHGRELSGSTADLSGGGVLLAEDAGEE